MMLNDISRANDIDIHLHQYGQQRRLCNDCGGASPIPSIPAEDLVCSAASRLANTISPFSGHDFDIDLSISVSLGASLSKVEY
jgi:hypothetical protein